MPPTLPRKVAITGARGLIDVALIKAPAERGDEVRILNCHYLREHVSLSSTQ